MLNLFSEVQSDFGHFCYIKNFEIIFLNSSIPKTTFKFQNPFLVVLRVSCLLKQTYNMTNFNKSK